jgi:hypothetical protein
MLRRLSRLSLLVLALALLPLHSTTPAHAHQPYCEEEDLTLATAWHVKDPSVSVAYYGTLGSENDADFFSFDSGPGQKVLLAMTIPQIAGQENFAPAMLLWWYGSVGDESTSAKRLWNLRLLVLPAPPGTPSSFFEPFSRTSYRERQEQWVTLPADGRYWVTVWNPEKQVGRYVFVIGQKEVMGGDIDCLANLSEYFTPVTDADHAH